MADFKAKNPKTVTGKHRAGSRPVNLLKTNTFLPSAFQTPINKKWLDATLDKMVSKGDLEDIDAFIGSTSGSALGKWNDYYLNTNTSHKQLEPAITTSNLDCSNSKDAIRRSGFSMLDILYAAARLLGKFKLVFFIS